MFTDESGTKPLSIWTLEDQHKRMRQALKLAADAVVHSFYHVFSTRLGATGTAAFTIMTVMHQSAVVVSQKRAHPTPKQRNWLASGRMQRTKKPWQACPEWHKVS